MKIYRTFVFPGPSSALVAKMNELTKNGSFDCQELDSNQYRINSTISLGTAIFSGGGGSPINVRLKIESYTNQKSLAIIQTKIRIEHYVLFGAMIIFSFGLFMSNYSWYSLVYLVISLFAFHAFLHVIYRWQENSLINNIKIELNLSEKRDLLNDLNSIKKEID